MSELEIIMNIIIEQLIYRAYPLKIVNNFKLR